jgi:hypothetical protein
MNCDLSQRRLLEAPSPDEPPPEVASHLADCPACRAWQRQLVRIERHVPLLPVPASKGKEPFLQLLQLEADPASIPIPAPPPVRRRRYARPLVFGLGGIAAAVALVFLAGPLLRVFQGQRGEVQAKADKTIPKPPDAPGSSTTLVARLVEVDMRLAQANTPRQCVLMLAQMADAVHDEAKTLGRAEASEALQAVIQMYSRVIQDGLVKRATALPPEERREVLNPIAARLADVEREVDEVARAAGPTTAERLRRVAMVARDGDAQLRALIVQGGAP